MQQMIADLIADRQELEANISTSDSASIDQVQQDIEQLLAAWADETPVDVYVNDWEDVRSNITIRALQCF